MSKRIISVFLALLMLIPPVAFASAQSDSDCGFAVATDLHYVHPLSDADARWSDTMEMTFNSSGSMQNESGFIIDEFLRQCANNKDCDYVFICGDIVTYGRDRVTDHEDVAAKFRKFEKETGKQVYVINGNHDNGVGSQTDSAKFREIYNEFGYDNAFSVDETCCSYATELNDKYVLIALDSFDEQYMLANGVDTARLKWVKEQTDYAKKVGKYPIVIMHHNLLEHQPLEALINDKYIVSMPHTVATLFAQWGIKLVFSGHTHMNDTASLTTASGKVIYDFCNAALNSYPLNYKTFTLTDEKITYETKSIENIDFNALTSVVKTGYDEHELYLLKNNFKEFAKEYNTGRGLSFIDNGITPDFIGIEKDSIIYEPVKKITDELSVLLKKPLYGENGISAIAAEYSVNIPQTDYEYPRDLITELYSDVVTGGCSYEYNSAEIQIVTGIIETAIHLALSDASEKELLALAKEINPKTTVASRSLAAAEYLALAIAYPFIHEYINQTDGIDNIQGTLDGYGTADSLGLSNLGTAAENNVNRISLYFEMFIHFIKKSFSVLIGIA